LRDADLLTGLLQVVLSEISEFADARELSGFATTFRKAESCLSADDPLTLVYHQDLAPLDAIPLRELRLLCCCQLAWVFGGMGSWNDVGFDGDEHTKYEDLSQRLFELLNESICVATNSTAR